MPTIGYGAPFPEGDDIRKWTEQDLEYIQKRLDIMHGDPSNEWHGDAEQLTDGYVIVRHCGHGIVVEANGHAVIRIPMEALRALIVERKPMSRLPYARTFEPKETEMHPAVRLIAKHFTYEHLPDELAEVSKPFCDLANSVAHNLEGPEATVCLRKLLEAKDCAVRAKLEMSREE